MIFKGNVWKFGKNINTDVIMPARYINASDPKELGLHCMEDIDSDFVKNISKGDIIVAEENFGCGSSREHAPVSIKAAGISCIIAKSFARIFYRNAINIGLPILEMDDFVDECTTEDIVEVDLLKEIVKNLTKDKIYKTTPFPRFIRDIVYAGGLKNYIKETGGL
ncbi:2,3-dimethylmalate dehydratase small subunit [subsurface metagenome]